MQSNTTQNELIENHIYIHYTNKYRHLSSPTQKKKTQTRNGTRSKYRRNEKKHETHICSLWHCDVSINDIN